MTVILNAVRRGGRAEHAWVEHAWMEQVRVEQAFRPASSAAFECRL